MEFRDSKILFRKDYPHLLDTDSLLLVKLKGDWPDANIQTNAATGSTQRRHKPKVTRIIVRWLFSRGDICRHGVMRLVKRGFGYSWTFFSTPVPRVQWVGISNFITCHKRDTGCSGEHCSLPPPHSPHPLARQHTRPWKSCLEKEDKDFPSGRLQQRPANVHIVFWHLIDLRAVKSS